MKYEKLVVLFLFLLPFVWSCSDDDKDASSPPAADITQPAAGDEWLAGATYNIQWTGTLTDVAIYYTASGGTPGMPIGSVDETHATNWQNYPWNVPDTIHSDNCRIRVAEYLSGTPYGDSDVFSIKQIIVDGPVDESFTAGDPVDILFRTTQTQVSTVTIEYYDGAAWNTIDTNVDVSTATSHTYAWTTPTDLDSTQVGIRITDNDDSGVDDETNGTFTVAP